MASDNEDDDLDALREAALATLKQKVQPIENVFSGKNAVHSHNSAVWSDVPASIDFPAFSDPIPESSHFPSPYEEPAHQLLQPQHLFRPATNVHWNQSHQNRMPYQAQRMRHPRFPHRTFGDIGERGNRRGRPRGYLPPHAERGVIPPGNHPHHPSMSLPPQTPIGAAAAMGNNLIVIQPHTATRGELVPALTPINTSSSLARNVPINHSHSDNPRARPKLVLPQDKYHSSGDSTSIKVPDKEPEPEVKKSKDKFSRYDKSDSEEDEDDNASEVDDIANEIDKVLQDDFLAEEIAVQEAEETEAADNKVEAAATEEAVTEQEEVCGSEPASPVISDKQANEGNNCPTSSVAAASDISDSESLDLDALAGGEPVIGDLEDLDCLVDKEPESVVNTSDKEPVINTNSGESSPNSNGNGKNSDLKDTCNGRAKKDTENRASSKENAVGSNKHSLSRRHSPLSPSNYHNSSSRLRYSNSISPSRRYDSYNNKTHPSPKRTRSPMGSRQSTYRRSMSPRPSLRPRSPVRRRSPIRRLSISPRRRAVSPVNRKFESSLRRYPGERARRRSISPNRKARSPSPRDKHRPGPVREESRRHRDYNSSSRPGESSYRESDRYCRDRGRPQPVERGRDTQRETDVKVNNSESKTSVNKRISPLMEKNICAQEEEKVSIDLKKLTPEERIRIEARRKKFDSSAEVKVAEASKKISLKDIKKREKKSKKKEEEIVKEVETLKSQETLPDVINKRISKSGISLKKLRKKQESKLKRGEEEAQGSPEAAGVMGVEDDSEGDSDEDRSWKKESAGALGPTIKFGVSRTMVNKAPLVSLDSIDGGRKYQDFNRRRFPEHKERRSHSDRLRGNKKRRVENNRWSSDEDSDKDGVLASRLSSSVVTSKPFKADIAPEKLHIQVHIGSKAAKKKTKAVPDFSNVYSVHAKRRRVADVESNDEEEKNSGEVGSPKKSKKKKKKHSKEENPRDSVEFLDQVEMTDTISRSPTKTSVLERLGKKVSLESLEKKGKKKKKSKKNRDIDEDTDDLDLHILKMKAKNEQIIRRQREIQLDKERYG